MNDGVELKVERIYRIEGDKPLKGFADISIAGSFIIKGLRIVAGKNGLFVGMPQELGKNGKWYDRVDLINDTLKDKLAEMVISAFDES